MDQAISQRACYKCGYHGETAETVCPQCRRALQTSSSIRVRGALSVLCGVILMGLIGYVSVWSLAAVSSTTPGGARFTGTEQEKLLIFGLFAILMLFGFLSFAAGLWQLIFGRRSKVFVRITLALGVLIALGAGAIILTFK